MATIDEYNFILESEWVDESAKQRKISGRKPKLEFSLTKKCLQYLWSEAYCFPCCPDKLGTNPIVNYLNNLKSRSVFAYNENSPKLRMLESALIRNKTSLLIMCEREDEMCEEKGFKPWSLHEIQYKYGFFIHISFGSYFEIDEAYKVFISMQTN